MELFGLLIDEADRNTPDQISSFKELLSYFTSETVVGLMYGRLAIVALVKYAVEEKPVGPIIDAKGLDIVSIGIQIKRRGALCLRTR